MRLTSALLAGAAACGALLPATVVQTSLVHAPHVRMPPVAAAVRSRWRVPASPQLSAAADPEHDVKIQKALKAMVGFSNSYIKNTKTSYCMDPSIPAVVIKGLAEHKVEYGAALCPCRHYEDKAAEAKDGYWNCPCVPMRERHECHCMLFLTEENEFAGEQKSISLEETVDLVSGM